MQLEAEYARATGRAFVGALLDLRKAYELTRHLVLVGRALASAFPSAIARLAILLYSSPRVVVVEGACSVAT